MPTNQDVLAIGRGRRQPPFQFLWTRLDPFLKPWGERPAPHKLSFQSRRQPVFLRESRRKIALVLVIPSTNVAVTVPVVVMLALVVVISVFVVAFSVSIALCKCGTGGQHKKT